MDQSDSVVLVCPCKQRYSKHQVDWLVHGQKERFLGDQIAKVVLRGREKSEM